MISKIPEWSKDIFFLIVLVFMIVNEGGRIQNSEDIKIMKVRQNIIEHHFQEFKNEFKKLKEFSLEHTHDYSTGKPRLRNILDTE